MTGHIARPAPLLAAALLLAACGGGGGDGITPSGDSPARDPSFAVGTRNTGTVTLTGFEGDGTRVDGEGRINLATGAVSGDIVGTLNAARTRIDLAGGGSVTLTNPGATEYVRLFAVNGAADPAFGVIGFPSSPADLPGSGRVSYTGAAEIVAADSTRLYTLDGEAYIVADFGGDTVRIELRGLEGTAQGLGAGNTGPVAVPQGGAIVVDGSRISGATFSGGTASATGLPFTVTGSANASGTRGGFYGPDADEVAGRVIVDDPRGDVGILGTFAAD